MRKGSHCLSIYLSIYLSKCTFTLLHRWPTESSPFHTPSSSSTYSMQFIPGILVPGSKSCIYQVLHCFMIWLGGYLLIQIKMFSLTVLYQIMSRRIYKHIIIFCNIQYLYNLCTVRNKLLIGFTSVSRLPKSELIFFLFWYQLVIIPIQLSPSY